MILSKTQKELCKRFYEDTDVDIEYELKNEEYEDIDELMEKLEELAREDEVIYYTNAMQYLLDNDPSLQYSLEIAEEYGYSTKDLNSELLATLLKQRNTVETIEEYRDELEEAFFAEEETK